MLDGLFRADGAGGGTPPPDDDFWYEPTTAGLITPAGQSVTPLSSLQCTAVYACVRVIAETLASLPLLLYRRLPNGAGKERDDTNPLYDVLHSRPNAWQTTMEFVELMQTWVTLRGNAYAVLVPGARGWIDQMLPMHPDRVRVEQLPSYRLRYKYTTPNGEMVTLLQDEVLHIRGLSDDGVLGMSPIERMRNAVGLAQAAEEFGSRMFSNGVRPSGVLSHPGKLSDAAYSNLKNSMRREYAGAGNAAKLLILEEGIQYSTTSISPEEAQFLETRKYQVTDIARMFRVPPHMIADLERATFSNIEHQSLDFVMHTIRPWAVRWEQALSRSLLPDAKTHAIEFLLDGLLRGDAKARAEFYASGIVNGWMTRNEVRRRESLNDAEGLDEFLLPLNMATQAERDEQAEIARKAAERPVAPVAPEPESESEDADA